MTGIARRSLLSAAATVLAWPLRTLAAARPAKQVLAFYYGWYGPGSHWQSPNPASKTLADSPDFPTAGTYDSLDPAAIDRHVAEAKGAGITGLICSWWGQGDRTDQQLKPLLDKAAMAGLVITAYVENVTSPQALADACLYLLEAYGGHPAWLKLNGKPVIFLYDRVLQTVGLNGWKQARAIIDAKAPGRLAVIATGNGRKQIAERAPLFDGIHIYDMAFYLAQNHPFAWLWRRQFYDSWVKCQAGLSVTTATVMPGYDDHLVLGRPAPRPFVDRDNGKLYRGLWQAAISARPDWILIVSFNEWHEDSQIEPSLQYGGRELATTRDMSARFLS